MLIGSFPHKEPGEAVDLILQTTPHIPGWPQLPNRAPEEGMLVQYTEGIPGVVWVRSEGHLYINAQSPSFGREVLSFYELYLAAAESDDAERLAPFGMSAGYAAGFHALIERLRADGPPSGVEYLKGQVTGPVTLGLGLPDQTGRAVYYDDQLRDVVVKAASLKCRWQIDRLREFDKPVIIILDEPILASFGSSAMISVSREQVIADLTEVVRSIREAGAAAGVHCCGNTDWSLLFEADVDVVSLDAYDFGDSLFLYPEEMKRFLSTGGAIAWGIVPNAMDKVAEESGESLYFRYEGLINRLGALGFPAEEAHAASMFTPSCGMGALDIPTSERICADLKRVADLFEGAG